MRVLAFDPGYGITGWGCVEDPPLRALGYGAILTSAELPHANRLASLAAEARALLSEHRPEAVIVETLFVHRNQKTAGGVYEARGVLLCAAAEAGLDVIELGPMQIKKAVTGSGRAEKSAVHDMVQRLLSISKKIRPDDTADALAGAVAGIFAARSRRAASRLGGLR